MWQDAGASVIGPGWEVLARTGDKLQAKQLAEQCNVPVLKAMTHPTDRIADIRAFAQQVDYPVMIKAVDGGGGRGIRLVRDDGELESSVDRAIGESPSHTVFVEKAAVDGFHHIEVQVVGDGTGQVRHLWERDCSAQRRFQKIVECAPALTSDRNLVGKVIESALRMASTIRYRSLGTFEFLVNAERSEFYFLEINPRLQVEHTITESITGIDLVQTQLLLAQGCSLQQLDLYEAKSDDSPPTRLSSIQLRLCAEDPNNKFSLGIGKVTEFSVPSGNGIRVDTNVDVSGSSQVIVGSNFDNLLAKIIVTASSWEATVRKAQRVLADSRISGVKTNINLLRGIVAHEDLLSGKVDTQWLGARLDQILSLGNTISASIKSNETPSTNQSISQTSMPSSNLLFRKGDAWSVTLEPMQDSSQKQQHHLQLSRVLRNEFPSSLTAEIEYTTPSSKSAVPYRLRLDATSTSASALVSSSHRRGDSSNPRHIVLPLSGKLIEVLVSEGDRIAENQVLAFVKQMKMELEVRSPRAGKAKWAFEMEDEEEDVAEGMLLVELEEDKGKVEVRGKL
ncbi:hypothetical protein AWENTII_003690 [Aspergillus wentii]|nr:hypothetical protein MW887_011668 [Aspergillus wentii]